MLPPYVPARNPASEGRRKRPFIAILPLNYWPDRWLVFSDEKAFSITTRGSVVCYSVPILMLRSGAPRGMKTQWQRQPRRGSF